MAAVAPTSMTGGDGDDTYYIAQAGDQVIEQANQLNLEVRH